MVAAGVERQHHQVGSRDPVDHAVMDLGDQRPAAARQALDHPHLPQRAMPVEFHRHQSTHQVVQLQFATRGRQSGVTNVVHEVEVRVVDPHRGSEMRRVESAGDHVEPPVALVRDENLDRVAVEEDDGPPEHSGRSLATARLSAS